MHIYTFIHINAYIYTYIQIHIYTSNFVCRNRTVFYFFNFFNKSFLNDAMMYFPAVPINSF